MNIVAVYGCTGKDSNSLRAVKIMAQAAEQVGGEVTHFNLLENELPPMRVDQNFKDHAQVQRIHQLCREAEGFILVSPDYHGCMSNWMKNFFDFHYHEFAGKLFALVATTGGSLGVSCNTQMRVAIQHCHGWTLPYQTAVRESDVVEGEIQNHKVIERLERMGRDLVVYGRLLRQQFQTDLQEHNPGFAGWYA